MIAALIFGFVLARQDVPVEIPKSELPKAVECVVCNANGAGHGAEKPAAGLRYKGASYFFCNVKEVAEFKKDPTAYLPPVLPKPMADFSISDLSGKIWNGEAMRGKVVLIDFWATWCGPCKAMFPMLDKLYKEFRPQGFEMLSVSTDQKRADLDKYLKGHPFPNPVLHDTTGTWNKWGVRAIPALFLVKDGQVIAQWTGKQTEATMRTAVAAALESK